MTEIKTTEEASVASQKRASVSLVSGEGDSATRLTIIARRLRGDRWETSVITTDPKGKNSRGMTAKFDSFDAAAASMAVLMQEAIKKGCKRRERVGGFKPRPDAFSTMPTAPKSRSL